MAIDSAEKRRSLASISLIFMGPGVTPNASKDVEWRQEAGFGYPGITPTSDPIPETGGSQYPRGLGFRLGLGM